MKYICLTTDKGHIDVSQALNTIPIADTELKFFSKYGHCLQRRLYNIGPKPWAYF